MCGQFAIMKRLGFVMGFVITAAGAWAQQYVISSVAGSAGPLHANLSGFSGDGGPATSALLNDPTGVAVDGAGNLFIADTYNSAIRKSSPAGIITTVAGDGNGSPGYSGDSGPAASAQLFYPSSLRRGRLRQPLHRR